MIWPFCEQISNTLENSDILNKMIPKVSGCLPEYCRHVLLFVDETANKNLDIEKLYFKNIWNVKAEHIMTWREQFLNQIISNYENLTFKWNGNLDFLFSVAEEFVQRIVGVYDINKIDIKPMLSILNELSKWAPMIFKVNYSSQDDYINLEKKVIEIIEILNQHENLTILEDQYKSIIEFYETTISKIEKDPRTDIENPVNILKGTKSDI